MADSIISFRIADKVKQKLDTLSLVTSRDASSLAEEALNDYLARQDWRMAAIDETVSVADEGNFISDKAMTKWLESWGSADELPPPGVDVFKRG